VDPAGPMEPPRPTMTDSASRPMANSLLSCPLLIPLDAVEPVTAIPMDVTEDKSVPIINFSSLPKHYEKTLLGTGLRAPE